MFIKLKCDNCNKIFLRKKGQRIKKNVFCSKPCSSEFRKDKKFIYEDKWITLKCKNCNKEFSILKSSYRGRGKKYCSKECYLNNKRNQIIIKCAFCGKEKSVNKSYVERGQFIYCSKKCADKVRLKGVIEEELIRNCITCGQEFRIKPSEINKNRKHCSKKCSLRKEKYTCLCCGKEFEGKSYRKRFFCSNKCYKAYKGETSIEKIVREYLEGIGIKFKTQVQFKNYVVDFLLPEHKTIIEADGDYWHSTKRALKSDPIKDSFLNKCGFEVIRLKEKDILKGKHKEILCFN